MGRQVYQEANYKVYRAGNDYVIHNATYAFDSKHTHLKSLNIAKQVISCLIKGTLPKTRNAYVLTSLLRLTDNDTYYRRIDQLIQVRRQKGPKERYQNHATV